MADSNFARNRNDVPDFADDDPLAELARIVGYDERLVPKPAAAERREPAFNLEDELLQAKRAGRQQLSTALAVHWPRRLVDGWLRSQNAEALGASRLADLPDARIRQIAAGLHAWRIVPTGTVGYKKAEVMRGGVDTRAIDQKTMQARRVPGLHIIGEALDVTGWLGGYNFQWAWASGVACGRALTAA